MGKVLKTNCIYIILACLLTAGCATDELAKDSLSKCLNSADEHIMEKLYARNGLNVCICGPVRLQPHGLYFETPVKPDTAWNWGKIYLPIRLAEAWRAGLVDQQIFEFRGVLSIEKGKQCNDNSCYIAYLEDDGV